MYYRSRELVGANVCTLFRRSFSLFLFLYTYLAMGTLIRIRNVCFCYNRKSGVVSIFQDIEWKKWSYVVFLRVILKKMEIRDYSGIMLKKIEF